MALSRSERGLDFLNFFIADVQTGFGPFISVYLTENKWTQIDIGFALTLGTITALVSQVPAGALVDAMRRKRMAAGFGILSIAGSALLLALMPERLPVYIAEILHGFASCILTPAIAAVSLRLVGHAAFGERVGRNARFASLGNGIAAGAMGLIGSYVSTQAVFWLTAALAAPGLIALSVIAPAEHGHRERTVRRFQWSALREIGLDRRVQIFFMCALLFHLSNAAMLPLAGAEVTRSMGARASLIIAACIVVPQAVVALLSPWVGRTAAQRGRRIVLLIGWGSLPVRAVVMALFPDPYVLVGVQALSGISAAVFGVMLPVVAADFTRNTGRFNLCMGVISLAVFVGASLSTTLAGWMADSFGDAAAFLGLAVAGAAGAALVWFVMPETREEEPALAQPTRERGRDR